MYVGPRHLRPHRARRRVADLIRVPFLAFVRAIREPFLIAFTTASSRGRAAEGARSHGALRRPQEHRRRSCCRPATASISTASTLYLSLASVFVAQMAGVSMTIGQQLVMMLTLMLTSKGVAGVPRAALVVLDGDARRSSACRSRARRILLGIDQIMDMGRTAVNVMGNCIATAVVARWEGVLDDQQMRDVRGRSSGQGGLTCASPSSARAGSSAPPSFTNSRSGRHDVIPFSRQALDVTDDAAVDAAMARARPDAIINCAAYNDVDAAEDHPVDALNAQRVRRANAGARGRASRRDARPLRQRLRVRRQGRRRRTRKTRSPNPLSVVRRVEAAGRVVRARRAARVRPARREPVRTAPGGGPPKGSVAGILKGLQAGVGAQCLRRPDGLAHLHHRCRARDPAAARIVRPDGSLSLRQLRVLHVARIRYGARAAARPRTAADACQGRRRHAQGPSAAVLRAVESKSCARRASRCRPGRMRSRDTSGEHRSRNARSRRLGLAERVVRRDSRPPGRTSVPANPCQRPG